MRKGLLHKFGTGRDFNTARGILCFMVKFYENTGNSAEDPELHIDLLEYYYESRINKNSRLK